MSVLPITTTYASLLALVLLLLSIRVIQGRTRFGVSLGDGGHAEMTRRIRAHANFVEYVPLMLLLLALLELAALPGGLLHLLGASLLVARLLHGFALAFTERWVPGRFLGTLLTFITLLAMALAGLYAVAISA